MVLINFTDSDPALFHQPKAMLSRTLTTYPTLSYQLCAEHPNILRSFEYASHVFPTSYSGGHERINQKITSGVCIHRPIGYPCRKSPVFGMYRHGVARFQRRVSRRKVAEPRKLWSCCVIFLKRDGLDNDIDIYIGELTVHPNKKLMGMIQTSNLSDWGRDRGYRNHICLLYTSPSPRDRG